MVLLTFGWFLVRDTAYPCRFFSLFPPGKCHNSTNTGLSARLMFLLQFAETCRPCGINICDISVGKRSSSVCKTGYFKVEICFEFGNEAFLKKREVTVGQIMVYIYRQVSFYTRVRFVKNITHVEHKIPVQNVFSGG